MPSPFSEKNALFLLTILETVEKIKIYVNGFQSAEDLFNAEDQLRYNAVCHLLMVIGEESAKIEKSLKGTQSFVAWNQISGMRNRIAHDYRGIDKEIVFLVVKNELPILQEACRVLIRELKLDEEEIAVLPVKPTFKAHKILTRSFKKTFNLDNSTTRRINNSTTPPYCRQRIT